MRRTTVKEKARTLLVALILALILSPAADAQPPVKPKTATLLVFRPKICHECDAVQVRLDEYTQTLTSGQLHIVYHTLGTLESQDAFTQHQVTTLPQYILLDTEGHVALEMKQTIEPEQLVWDVKEALGQNPTLQPPQALQKQFKEYLSNQTPMVILFRHWQDPNAQSLADAVLQEGSELLGETPALISLDSNHPDVRAWMQTLGLQDAPAYVMVTPKRTVYRVSSAKPAVWQLVTDLRAYAHRFNSEFQTILAGLTSPVPDDEYILPATNPPPNPPASSEMFRPE